MDIPEIWTSMDKNCLTKWIRHTENLDMTVCNHMIFVQEFGGNISNNNGYKLEHF